MPEAWSTRHALDRFNSASAAEAAEWLRACNSSHGWNRAMLAARPYVDVQTLLDTAERESRALPWPEVLEALAAHPRIGESPDGPGTDADWSRREQAAMADADTALRRALMDGNRAYEKRFGHVFLIRAAGREGPEMLAALQSRLANDEVTEQAVVVDQLAQITRIRVERLLTE